MKPMMTIALLAVLALPVAVCALDNTVNDDFWDTRAYVNPSVSSEYGATDAIFEAFGTLRLELQALDVLDTHPVGLTIVLR